MATKIATFLSLVISGTLLTGCATRDAHPRAAAPRFADAAPRASTESWASVMALPGIEADPMTLARRDSAMGLAHSGHVGVAGAWREQQRPSIDRWLYIHVPRSDRTLLFFDGPRRQHERRTPWVPHRAHPWRAAW